MLLPTTAPHCRTPESLDDSVPTLSLLLFEASVATIVIALIATTLLGTFPTHFLYVTITSLLALALGVSTARKRKQNNCVEVGRTLYHLAFWGEAGWAIASGPLSAGTLPFLISTTYIMTYDAVRYSGSAYGDGKVFRPRWWILQVNGSNLQQYVIGSFEGVGRSSGSMCIPGHQR